MGELAQEYEGRVRFEVVPAEETKQRQDEIDEYGFTAQMHGLVGFDRSGAAAVKMPGHMFGKEEIDAAIQTLLATDS